MHTDPTYPIPLRLDTLKGMKPDDITLPPLGMGLKNLAIKLAIVLTAVFAVHLVMNWATARAAETENSDLMIGVLGVLLFAYALLIAVPFMPGIEIGITLLMLEGASIAPLVYLATVFGLLLAYAAGRYLPPSWLRGILADMRLKRACALVDRLAPMSHDERLAHLTERAPKWLRPALGSGRYVLLAVLFNVPGNSVIGGGGGIAFIAGFSRLFRPSWTALTIVLAVLPVPLIVWTSGSARLIL